MNTPSHFLMTAALEKRFPRIPIAKSAFLLGSIAPDIPLYILSIGGILYYHVFLGWSLTDTFNLMFDRLYFHNPLWMASHNLLHSPILLLLGLALLWRFRSRIASPRHWWFWFLSACLFHSIIDILTHVDDGPLLLFPLEWTTRWQSPVSYWDRRHYGREFAWFEGSLDVLLTIYLVSPWVSRRLRRGWKRFNPDRD
ncbi:metal-dependent hydrolase [Oscillatoriales cyanobacterium LEGE 11467]|uniref:Metal-dependent hydrolase n=1 Tax=Zarconia navalis LEGE 11467 TaxID=1828826 RepID=A0A928Z759_9CYAN|nr:metal-dependent hydrolase [Zarconia navalis]MBE9039338.1 metal-dependent hydrolase [Zarconia navalis LEGE 11467]